MPNTNQKTHSFFNPIQNLLFLKTPLFLLDNEKYASLTNDERMAYVVINDRFRFSEANGWIDEKGEYYIYFTIEALKKKLHIGKNKAIKVKKHLADIGLIRIEHSDFDPLRGQTPPDRFYLLTPEYEPEDLIPSRVPKVDTRKSKANFEENVDASSNSTNTPKTKTPESLENNRGPKIKHDKNNNSNKDIIKDDPSNYSQEVVEEQNRDLLHNLANTLSTDPAIPMFLSKESINLITLWFKTPKEVSDCISVILNAANSSRRNATEQIGRHELYFEDCQGELKRMISFKLRRFFNKMRASKKGAIKSPRNYLFIAMRNMFDKWQNDVLMREHEANINANA